MAAQTGCIVGIDKTMEGESYRVLLYKYNNTKWDFSRAEVSERVLINSIIKGKVELSNADVVNGKLHGTVGSLDRFKTEGANRPLVIISELRTDNDQNKLLGYKVATYDGKVKNIKLNDIILYCCKVTRGNPVKAVPIQNAMFVDTQNGIAAHIKGYVQNQFIVERITVNKPKNIESAQVNTRDNSKQVSKLEEIFNKQQIKELMLGREHGVNYKLYGNASLSAEQMKELRKALEDGVDPRPYASSQFKADTMKAYRIQQKYGVDIRNFINPKYNVEQIYELSTGVLSGIDIAKIADPSKSASRMAKERIELESKIWKETNVSVIDILDTFS